MKKIIFLIFLLFLAKLSFAETNYVVYSTNATVFKISTSFAYDVDKDILAMEDKTFQGIDWSTIRAGYFTGAYSTNSASTNDLPDITQCLPLSAEQKTDMSIVFNAKTIAVAKGIVDAFNAKLPAQYRVSDAELKAAVKAELNK